MVDLKVISELAQSEAVFAILFVLGLFVVGKWLMSFIQGMKEENATRESQLLELHSKQSEDAQKREEFLRNHLDKSNEKMGEISDTMKGIQAGLNKLEDRMDANFLEVWKEIGKTKK